MRIFLPNFLLLALLLFLPYTAYTQCTNADSGELTINPPIPADGTNYPGGTVVDMCFTLNEFNTPSVNWLHSIIPTFGPGFDFGSFTATSTPTSCAGNGNWSYYGTPWTSCNTGQTFGPGFAFDGNGGLGCGGTPSDGDPGNNYGDGGFLCANRTWCWQLTTVPVSPFSCQLLNYNTIIYVYGDAETGSWNPPSPPCLNDDPLCEPGLINLRIEQTASPCGCNQLNAVWDNQVLGQNCGLDIQWTGPGGFTSTDLNPEVCQSGVYNLEISIGPCIAEMATANVFITGTPPVATATANPSPVCLGDDITFTASDLGPGATYTWNIDGSTYTGQTVTIPATGSSVETATLSATDGAGCEADPVTVVYVVLPVPDTEMTVMPDSLCTGQTAIVNGNNGAGDESWDFGAATVLSGSGNGPYELSFPSAGTYTIFYEKANTVCSSIDSVEIVVFEALTETIAECTVSANDSITFNWDGVSGAIAYEVIVNGGSPIMVSDTFFGVGDLANGAMVTLGIIPVGNPICPLPDTAFATCTVFNCPTGTLEIDQLPANFCLSGNNIPLELTFTAEASLGTFTDTVWAGPGVIDNAFNADSAGLGTHLVTLTVTNVDGCTYNDDVEFTVLPLPSAAFTVTDTICSTATSLVTYTGGADPLTSTFTWDFDGGTAVSGVGPGPHDVSWPAGGNYTIALRVEDDQACVSDTFFQVVTVIDPLPVPSPGCGLGGLDSVSFNWLDIPGATGYVISIDGGTPFTITDNFFGVGGLNEGDAVNLTIFALGDAPCGNSTDTTITCVAEACPSITVAIDEDPNSFCLGQDPNFSLLEIAQNTGSGTGTYVWSGPGVMNDTFYIDVAGVGTHEIRVLYTEGLCTYEDTVEFQVFETPQAVFSLSDTTVCEGQVITVTNEVAMFPTADYVWDFPGANPPMATGIGPHTISYDAAGVYTITQTVTSNGCSTDTTIDVTVIEPLVAPIVSCDQVQQLEEITYFWTAVVPNIGYEVTIDGVVVDTVNSLDYTVSMLTPDTTVSITVRALNDGVCGDGPASDAVSCSTASCPTITLSPSIAVDSFCLGSNDTPVALTATSAGGDMTGTFIWSGTGVTMAGTGFEFDPVAAGVGTHVLIVDYVETAGCSATDSITVHVFDIPTADFTLSDTLVCLDEMVTVTYDGTATIGVATFDWDFGGATVVDMGNEVYELSFPASGTYNISLTVTENGCVSSQELASIVVEEPLLATTISCGDETLTSVTFEWTAVTGATGYEVIYNGTIDTVNSLSQLVDGLVPGEEVTITVTPLGDEPCGNGPDMSESCTADTCATITVTPSAGQTSFCLNGNPGTTILSATSAGGDMTGTFTWSGLGVSLVGTDYVFDPAETGSGEFVLTVDYVETAGCSGSATLTMNVFEVPTAAFTLVPDTICSNSFTTVTYTGTATSAANYDWDFDGATVVDLGDQTYELSWPAAGTYAVSLIVSEAGCSSGDTSEVEVFDPLADPAPMCLGATYTSVTFGWNEVVGATGYILSINGGSPFVIDSTTHTIFDLLDGEEVTLSVTAQGNEPCNNSMSVTVSCSTDPCPDVNLSPSAVQDAFCAAAGDEPTLLSAGLNGGSGGDITWSGTGVEIGSDSNYYFNPAGLAPGQYALTVTYTESICTYSNSMEVTINEVPVSLINASVDDFCTTTTSTVSFAGVAGGDAVFNWDFDGATVTDLGNESYELSWSQPGTHQVSLTVEQNGCTDVASFNLNVTEPPVAGAQNVPAAVCENAGDFVEMRSLISGASDGGTWSPNAGAPAAAVDAATGLLNTSLLAPGSYEYLYTVSGGVCDDAVTSVFVTVEPAPIADAGATQLLTCTMGMVSLNGSGSSGSGDLAYLWTGPDGNPVPTDPTSAMIDVAIPGVYTLTVTSALGCSASAEVVVEAETEVPVPQVELSNISCFGSTDGTILVQDVSGGRPPYNYSLNGTSFGSTNFFTGLDQGEYNLRVTDANGCFTELFLGLDRPDELTVSVELPNDQTIYDEGDQVTIVADITGGNAIDTLIWQPDSLNRGLEGFSNVITFPADESRTIAVTVIDENGCMASDQTNIIVRKERNVYFPTGFSPNGDNINDVLFIGANEEKVEEIQEFLVFNRWGESIFENYNFQPNEPAQGWDGSHRGELLNPQVLVYYAKVKFRNGDEVVYKGDITLIR